MKKISIRRLKNPFYLLSVIVIILLSYFYKGDLNSLIHPGFISTTPTVKPTVQISASSTTFAKVIKVIDGDTIEIENKQKVRYIGINTPELHDPRKKVECFGKEAMEKNKELVQGKDVRLEKDISETDKYGRLLRYVYLPTEASPSGEFVNALLVKEGYALASTFPPDVKYAQLFRQLEQDARENKRGLWNKCIA